MSVKTLPSKAIIDSNVFIASWHKRDQYNDASVAILKKLVSGEIHDVYITNYVVMEVVNFLMRKASFAVAKEAFGYLTKTDRIHVVYVDKLFSLSVAHVFSTYGVLTLTDCSLVVLAEREGIKTLYSFDEGFDRVKNVQRLEA
jgi:predicted nucleic acid-binding protein